jgi:putative sigma-54 modulation protein
VKGDVFRQKEFAVIVTVSTRHMDVTTAMKSYAEQKANKLTKYYDRIQEIEVVFDAGKDKTSREKARVEMIVTAEHNNRFIAHHEEGDAYACVDGCVDKLERQLSEHKKMFRNRKHDVGEDKREMNTEI